MWPSSSHCFLLFRLWFRVIAGFLRACCSDKLSQFRFIASTWLWHVAFIDIHNVVIKSLISLFQFDIRDWDLEYFVYERGLYGHIIFAVGGSGDYSYLGRWLQIWYSVVLCYLLCFCLGLKFLARLGQNRMHIGCRFVIQYVFFGFYWDNLESGSKS